jgi:hypothetical protein
MKQKQADKIVSVDAGWSSLRVATYSPQGNKIKIITVSPYEAEIFLSPQLGDVVSPEKLWIGYGDREFVIGEIAIGQPGGLIVSYDQKKYERAVRFVLGALGYLANVGYLDWGTPLCLGLLLPYLEYQDKAAAEEMLRYHLEGYRWGGKTARFNLQKFVCCPEGAGVYSQCGNPALRRVLVASIGFRDASILHVLDGYPDTRSETVALGMNAYVELIQQGYSVPDKMKLTTALVKSGWPLKDAPLLELIQTTDPVLRENELIRLKAVIESARLQYEQALKNWLKKHLDSVDEIIFCGGTALFLMPMIRAWFKEWGYSISLNWCDPLTKKMFRMGIKGEYNQFRTADNIGLLLELIGSDI